MSTSPARAHGTWPAPTSHENGAGLTTIVVGFDGSDSSWRALWWACGEARRLAGRAIAVYVTCATNATAATAALATGFDAGAYALASEQCNAERAAALKAELARATADLDVDVRFLHLQGSPADQLTRIAGDTHADVIAVGRSTKLRHQLAGSLGHGLSRNRKAPIVVIVP